MAEGKIYEVVKIGDPVLKKLAVKVDDIEGEKQFYEDMVATLRHVNGAGIAAPQVGRSLRAFIVEIRKTEMYPDREESPLYVIINPEIIERSDEKNYGWEGCLSVPGYTGRVPRYNWIKMKYYSPDGVEHVEVFEGYMARVMQHEYDHLDGIVYLQRMESMTDLYENENWKKYVLNNK